MNNNRSNVRSFVPRKPRSFRGIEIGNYIAWHSNEGDSGGGSVLGFRGDCVLVRSVCKSPTGKPVYVTIGINEEGEEVSVQKSSAWLVPFKDIVGVAEDDRSQLHRYDSTDHPKVEEYRYKYPAKHTDNRRANDTLRSPV